MNGLTDTTGKTTFVVRLRRMAKGKTYDKPFVVCFIACTANNLCRALRTAHSKKKASDGTRGLMVGQQSGQQSLPIRWSEAWIRPRCPQAGQSGVRGRRRIPALPHTSPMWIPPRATSREGPQTHASWRRAPGRRPSSPWSSFATGERWGREGEGWRGARPGGRNAVERGGGRRAGWRGGCGGRRDGKGALGFQGI